MAPSSLAGSHSRGKKSHLETRKQMGVVVHAYDSSIWEVEAVGSEELKISLGYIVSSKPDRAL